MILVLDLLLLLAELLMLLYIVLLLYDVLLLWLLLLLLIKGSVGLRSGQVRVGPHVDLLHVIYLLHIRLWQVDVHMLLLLLMLLLLMVYDGHGSTGM